MTEKKCGFSLEDYFLDIVEYLDGIAIHKLQEDIYEGVIPESEVKRAWKIMGDSEFHFPQDTDEHHEFLSDGET